MGTESGEGNLRRRFFIGGLFRGPEGAAPPFFATLTPGLKPGASKTVRGFHVRTRAGARDGEMNSPLQRRQAEARRYVTEERQKQVPLCVRDDNRGGPSRLPSKLGASRVNEMNLPAAGRLAATEAPG
jgi:hypothetical protein